MTRLNGARRAATSGEHDFTELRRRLGRELERADGLVRELARQQPLLAAGLALTAGFVIGRLVSRHA